MTRLMRALIIAMFAMSVGCEGADSGAIPTSPSSSNVRVPVLSVIPSATTIQEGEEQVFTVENRSDAPPPFTWIAGGVVLPSSGTHSGIARNLPVGTHKVQVRSNPSGILGEASLTVSYRWFYKSFKWPDYDQKVEPTTYRCTFPVSAATRTLEVRLTISKVQGRRADERFIVTLDPDVKRGNTITPTGKELNFVVPQDREYSMLVPVGAGSNGVSIRNRSEIELFGRSLECFIN